MTLSQTMQYESNDMSSSPIDSESMLTVDVIGCRYAMTVCEVRWGG
jgi:hypothetical protein